MKILILILMLVVPVFPSPYLDIHSGVSLDRRVKAGVCVGIFKYVNKHAFKIGAGPSYSSENKMEITSELFYNYWLWGLGLDLRCHYLEERLGYIPMVGSSFTFGDYKKRYSLKILYNTINKEPYLGLSVMWEMD